MSRRWKEYQRRCSSHLEAGCLERRRLNGWSRGLCGSERRGMGMKTRRSIRLRLHRHDDQEWSMIVRHRNYRILRGHRNHHSRREDLGFRNYRRCRNRRDRCNIRIHHDRRSHPSHLPFRHCGNRHSLLNYHRHRHHRLRSVPNTRNPRWTCQMSSRSSTT